MPERNCLWPVPTPPPHKKGRQHRGNNPVPTGASAKLLENSREVAGPCGAQKPKTAHREDSKAPCRPTLIRPEPKGASCEEKVGWRPQQSALPLETMELRGDSHSLHRPQTPCGELPRDHASIATEWNTSPPGAKLLWLRAILKPDPLLDHVQPWRLEATVHLHS